MTQIQTNLLAADALARSLGAGGLHPALRAALTAQLRFPAKRSGPFAEQLPGELVDDEKVVPLSPPQTLAAKAQGK